MVDALPKITDEIPLKIALHDLYETRFGIYNHVGSRPSAFASVSFHESENYMHDERFKRLVLKYHSAGIRELTGMSLIEFVNETTDTIESLLEVCSDIVKKKNEIKAEGLKDLENAIR